MDIDDIIDSSNTRHETFDKLEWSKKKQAEKQELYKLLDTTIEEIKCNSQKLQQYLNVQAQFDKYSVNNALLIFAQMPNATKLKEYNDWRKLHAFIKKNPVWIKILEPSNPYEKQDGTVGISYNLKRMIDISQTNVRQQEQSQIYDDKVLLKAFLHKCPAMISVVSNLENGKGAKLEDNTLYICKGMDTTTMFNDLSKELAKIYLKTNENSEVDNFKSYCVSYLICKKYNIDTSSYNFDNSSELLNRLEVSDIKNIFTDIRQVMENINIRMTDSLESTLKKTKEYER